ncbi:hypothetical protein L9G74_20300, partial [Shewanella sp. C32]|nr:hypothetical protein [Shewanella electrica]
LDFKPDTLFYRGKGCNHCKETGYRGRFGIFQLMLMTREVRDLVVKNATADQLRMEALKSGMITLREDGLEKARRGMTTVEEVLRVTQEV